METAKQVMINKLSKVIENFGNDIRANREMSLDDKVLQVDVLLDTLKFLDRYEENVRVLNEHYLDKER